MKKTLAVISILALSGCAMFSKPATVVTKPVLVERPKLEVADPEQAKQLPFSWVVITKDNFDSMVEDLEKKNQTVVFFALTPEGYQNLSISVAELRRYIQQQKAIIATVKEYYEKPISSDDLDKSSSKKP